MEADLIEYFKHAELFGSRGRARWKNEAALEGSDWDFIVFTDDANLTKKLRAVLSRVGPLRWNDFREIWVQAPGNVHLNIMPTFKRDLLFSAYAYQDNTGCSKAYMIQLITKWTKEAVERQA